MLAKNCYPSSYIDNCVKDLLNKKHMETKIMEKKTKKNIKYVVFKLPYLGPVSIQVQTEINLFFLTKLTITESKPAWSMTPASLANFSKSKKTRPYCINQMLFTM